MFSSFTTNAALTHIGDTEFEELIAWYLRETYPCLRGLISTGINENGKPIACPIDGIQYLAGSPPRCVSVAITTEMRRNLSGKWLGNAGNIGDIDKAAKDFATWKAGQPGIICELYIATNCRLGADVSLYRKAIERGRIHNIHISVIEASSLLHFLDHTREGHYVRQELLGIPANRMNLSLLRSLSVQTLDLHYQRFGSAQTAMTNLIPREAAPEVLHTLSATSGLIGLIGASGVGKSVFAQQIAREQVHAGHIVIWIPADWVVLDAPLVTTLADVLLKFLPSLNNMAGEDALRIATEQVGGITLLIDDVNRTGNASAILRTLERWVVRGGNQEGGGSGGKITLLVPLWPNEASLLYPSLYQSQKTRTAWHLISIQSYTEGEQRMLEAQQKADITFDHKQLVKVLSGDPFLCGLVSPHLNVAPNITRAELIRRLFEDTLHRASTAAEEYARAAGQMITVSEVGYSLDRLIELMLTADEPEPDWYSVRTTIGDRSTDILHYLAATHQLGWLASDSERTVWRWKHARMRDAIAGRWLARRVFQEWTRGELAETTTQWLTHPGLSEAWVLALAFAPNAEGQIRLIQLLGASAPLSLAYALRLGIFPKEQEQRTAIEQALRSVLSALGNREDEFILSLETLILAQLAETEDPMVLDLTAGLPNAWDVRFARLRNGDLEVVLRYFDSEMRHGEFPPMVNFRTLEDSLEALGRLYAGQEAKLVKQLTDYLQSLPDPEPAVLVMGYLGWSQFSDVICASWNARRGAEDVLPGGVPWRCYLWALGRCCLEEGKPFLEEMLCGVEALSEEREKDTGGTERYRRFGLLFGTVGRTRFPLSSAAAASWAKVAAERSNISRDLFSASKRVEDPVLVETYVRWYVSAKPFMWGEFVHNSDRLKDPQPLLKDNVFGVAVFRNPLVLERLWKLARQDTDADVRKLAFEIWRRSASVTELDQLRSIPEEDNLFDAALETRVRLVDETAGEVLSRKIRVSPAHWCAYAPRLYHIPEVKNAFLDTYAAALQGDEYEEGYTPRHLPVEEVPQFVERLRPTLLQTRRTWVSLFLTGVPEALALVQDAIAGANETDLELLFFSGLYGDGPITQRMLESLRPVLGCLPENDLKNIVEQALKDGQQEWILQHLSDYVSDPTHPRYWLNEADILEDFNALAERVPKGFHAVRATHYYHEVIDNDSHRPCTKEPYHIMRSWLGTHPTDAQITGAALAVVERGQTEDIAWWQNLQPQEASCLQHWKNTSRILLIRKMERLNFQHSQTV